MQQIEFFTELKPKLLNIQKCPACGSKIYLIDCVWKERKFGKNINFRLFLKYGCKECGLEGDFEEWRDGK